MNAEMNVDQALLQMIKDGAYQGKGYWVDTTDKTGNYDTQFKIETCDNNKVQTTLRHFYKDDGSLWYVENSVLTITEAKPGFITAEIKYEKLTSQGSGYKIGNACHFEIKVNKDIQLECTHLFYDERIEIIGSSTNKGNFTFWRELLRLT